MNVGRFVSCQDEYSLVVRDIEKDLLPAAHLWNGKAPHPPKLARIIAEMARREEQYFQDQAPVREAARQAERERRQLLVDEQKYEDKQEDLDRDHAQAGHDGLPDPERQRLATAMVRQTVGPVCLHAPGQPGRHAGTTLPLSRGARLAP